MMKALLATTAIIETATGIAVLVVPTLFASILFGAQLDTPVGVAVARLAGAALIALGVACGLGGRDTPSRAAGGIVAAMLFYNVAAAALFLWARYDADMTGIGLLPAAALHTALAVWCIACLRAARADERHCLQ
jgi:hypothetical protein